MINWRTISLIVLTAPAIVAGSWSCTKPVKVECDYTVRVFAQQTQGARNNDAYPDGKIFVFPGKDASQWYATTYEDALAGQITSLVDGATAHAEGEFSSMDNSINFLLTDMPVMLLICDTKTATYGWRDAAVVENLPRMNITAIFQHWYNATIEDEGTPEEGYPNIENGRFRRKASQNGWTMVYVNTAKNAEPEID